MSNNTNEPVYECVWPQGISAYKTRAPNARVDDLSGKVVGELWDYLFRGEEIFPILREELTKRFPASALLPTMYSAMCTGRSSANWWPMCPSYSNSMVVMRLSRQ